MTVSVVVDVVGVGEGVGHSSFSVSLPTFVTQNGGQSSWDTC